jgi:two-component system, response regulator PdtaR
LNETDWRRRGFFGAAAVRPRAQIECPAITKFETAATPSSGIRGFLAKAGTSLGAARLSAGTRKWNVIGAPSRMAPHLRLASLSGGPIRVVIVEDDVLVARDMEAVLQQAGAEVVAIARSFDAGLAACRSSAPTLALIDLELAGAKDGIELAHQLHNTSGIRTIFVTGHSDPKSVARGASAQPFSWIKKPFGPGTLVAAVQLAVRELEGCQA